jgi:hypothetical protein
MPAVDSPGREGRNVAVGPNIGLTARQIADARKPRYDPAFDRDVQHVGDAETIQLDPRFGDPLADEMNISLAVKLAELNGLSFQDHISEIRALLVKRLGLKDAHLASGDAAKAAREARDPALDSLKRVLKDDVVDHETPARLMARYQADENLIGAVVKYSEEHNLNMGDPDDYAAAIAGVVRNQR